MAITWPAKNNYATGDVLTATNMNGIGDDLNDLFNNNFYSGKNKIINGDFGIWQRGTSFTSSGYCADRFQWSGGTSNTLTRQTFTPGTAPVAGYEGQYFARYTLTTAGDFNLAQWIEDVRTFAGQTVTVSFWTKASAATSMQFIYLIQSFGSGGSADVVTSTAGSAITTSWTRHSYTVTLPSISGKTIGTNSFLNLRMDISESFTGTWDIWGVQLEAGSTATPFQTATGTKQGELAACQRYCINPLYTDSAANHPIAGGYSRSTTIAEIPYVLPVMMRVPPSLTVTASDFNLGYSSGANGTLSAMVVDSASVSNVLLYCTSSGLSANVGYILYRGGTSSALILSAEL